MIYTAWNFLAAKTKALSDDQSGVALTEYLVLLGLLVAALIIAVIAFGNNLAAAWNAWATWISSATQPPT